MAGAVNTVAWYMTVEKSQLWVAKVESEGEMTVYWAPDERRAFQEREK